MLNKKPSIQKFYRFQWEKAQNCYVLLYPEGVIKLNESAGVILNLCNGKNTVKNIISELSVKFEENESDIKQDIIGFIEQAIKQSWISYE